MEDKEGFVNAINEALVTYGGGRYDHLMDRQVNYKEIGGLQALESPSHRMYDITCDSLASILEVIHRIVTE